MAADRVAPASGPLEMPLLWVAAVVYLAAAVYAIYLTASGRERQWTTLGLVALALVLHTASIALRWMRLGHGPYVDMFEILSSNVWSLHLAALLVFVVVPRLQPALAGVLAILSVLTVWMLFTPVKDTLIPVTYATIWLPIHVTLGKIFLGLATPAAALGLILLLRKVLGVRVPNLPDSAAVEGDIYRFLILAVVFQSLMLIAGAAWAQNAWSRYWAWDPLESWAFITWTATLLYLHLRPRSNSRTMLGMAFSLIVFGLAFYTFFGVPFISTSPHKGAV